jgi:hypothetical protein
LRSKIFETEIGPHFAVRLEEFIDIKQMEIQSKSLKMTPDCEVGPDVESKMRFAENKFLSSNK